MELRVYKSGQGRVLRIGTAIGLGLVALVLAYYTYVLLERHVPKEFVYKVYLEYAVPAVLFAVVAGGTVYALNRPDVADFLIATESEMKKVSWSSRGELFGSTVVVLVTVVVLALLIWVADTSYTYLLKTMMGIR